MSNPPWAVDNHGLRSAGADPNLRTSDINIPYRKAMSQRMSASLETKDIVIPKRKHTNRVWGGEGMANLKTRDIAGQHNRLKHIMGPSVSTYGSGFKPRYAFETRDIDGAFCKRSREFRNTNPLNPAYKIPSHKPVPPPEPKQVRDNIQIHDISGAQVSSKFKHMKSRQTNKIEDIPGTKRLPQTYTRTFGHAADILDHRDITATDFKTKRLGHDPQSPTYTYGRSSDLSLSTILDIPAGEALKAKLSATGKLTSMTRVNQLGHIKGSKPTPIKPQKPIAHRSSNLRTADVPGAYFGWTPEWQIPRRDFGNPTRTDDIPGAQASTKKKLVTKRVTHPLEPRYRALDGRNDRRQQLKSTGREISQVTLG
eukprot:CAMPEP_0167821204 /NCGR_PEP_ID=MMETSP0112_2-20121227/6641_1 /TAXON_ID=91324 /ORGANISM="Lotharella globosa, Strain CCCM811" /LENGTH=367 /DNA_ID=CAMNT_0007722095 /DNA_START=79 /DNA_END=1182 /DNA_ORIENTATION=+